MPGLRTVHIRRFKNIEDAPFNLDDINVIVGANNSGKSSILQAIHFAIGTIQSLNLEGHLAAGKARKQTVDPTKLIYVPSDNVHALGSGGMLWESTDKSVQIDLGLVTGELLTLMVLKGRNRNIQVFLSDVPVARTIASLENPFTVFTPGLAGIAKTEQHVSDGVLLRTVARGDANIVLRNTLLRLWGERGTGEKWNKFLFDLRELFPSIDISVHFDHRTDQYISVTVNTEAGDIPLELSGTGVLQTIQILSYIHFFSPRIIVLDEPDSHLHPNNQRLICSLLTMIAKDRGIQVLLSTHSRHVIDALQRTATILWARHGTVEKVPSGSEISVLLDLGALDIKEQLITGRPTCLVLTEDDRTTSLKAVLESSGFDMANTSVRSYLGCTSPHNLRPLIQTIREVNDRTAIVVHGDRDYWTDSEITLWENGIRAMSVEPFVTKGTDIESHFLDRRHLAAINPGLSEDSANSLIDRAINETRQDSISHYVNGRCDIEKKARTFGQLNLGNLAAQAPQVYDSDRLRYCHSKTVVSKMKQLFQAEHGSNLSVQSSSQFLSSSVLSSIARRTFPQGASHPQLGQDSAN